MCHLLFRALAHLKIRFGPLKGLSLDALPFSLRLWYKLPSIGIGLHSSSPSIDGFRAAPHSPFPYNSIDPLRHAALPSLFLPLATVLTDSVIYIHML